MTPSLFDLTRYPALRTRADVIYRNIRPVMGAPDDTSDGHAFAKTRAENRVLREVLASAERFATHDPDIDWPSEKHDDPVDAICAALDRVREEAVAFSTAMTGRERGE